jgi:hypothetical protein
MLTSIEAGGDAPVAAQLLDHVEATTRDVRRVREHGSRGRNRVVLYRHDHTEMQPLDGHDERRPCMYDGVGDEFAHDDSDVFDQVRQVVLDEMAGDEVSRAGCAQRVRSKWGFV